MSLSISLRFLSRFSMSWSTLGSVTSRAMTWSKSRCSTRSCLSRSTFLKVSVSIFSVTCALDRCQPVPPLVAEGKEVRIQQAVLRVVPQRPPGQVDHTPPRTFEDSLRGGRVPFGRRPEARVNVRGPFGDETDLERAAHVGDLMRRQAREIRGKLRRGMAAAADDAQRRAGIAHGNRLRRIRGIAPPRSVRDVPEVHAVEHGRVNRA